MDPSTVAGTLASSLTLLTSVSEGINEAVGVQSSLSTVDTVPQSAYEMTQNIQPDLSSCIEVTKAAVITSGSGIRPVNSQQLQQQKLLLLQQQQAQLIRQQQMQIQQQYIQQQILQNALLAMQQQAQNQTVVAARPFAPSPVQSSPITSSGVSSAGFVVVPQSFADQSSATLMRPVSMTTSSITTPLTTPGAQPSLVHVGGVRMVPVAPFVANQLRPSAQPTMSRTPQLTGQRALGQSVSVGGLDRPVVMSTSVAGINAVHRPLLVSPTSQIAMAASLPLLSSIQSFPVAQLQAQVQPQQTRFVNSQGATTAIAPQQVAYVSPVLPSLMTLGDTNALPGGTAFQLPADMSSVLTDSLKLSPTLIGGQCQFIGQNPALTIFDQTASVPELSVTPDGRLIGVVSKAVTPQQLASSVQAEVSYPMPVVPENFSPASVSSQLAPAVITTQNMLCATVSASPSLCTLSSITVPSAIVVPSASTVNSVIANDGRRSVSAVNGMSSVNSINAVSDNHVTIISNEPDKADSLILTHVIEGFVIREGPKPFPIHKSFMNELPVSEDDDSDNSVDRSSDGDSSDQDEGVASTPAVSNADKVTISATPCEFCGKTGFEVRFGRPHRFCSLACSNKHHMSMSKHGTGRKFGSDGKKDPSGRHKAHGMDVCSPNNNLIQQQYVDESSPDRDQYSTPSRRQSSDAILRSPVFRQESPSKGFHSIQQPPPALNVRGPNDLHLCQWGVQEVFEFIKSLPGCSMYADEFRRQEIDGQALMLLTEDHMMTTLNIKLGPALKICSHIRALRDP